jgi:hypothetical protein
MFVADAMVALAKMAVPGTTNPPRAGGGERRGENKSAAPQCCELATGTRQQNRR